MKLCECPSCLKGAASFWNLGNAAFVLSNNKRCAHCSIGLKLNFYVFFCIMLLAAFNVIAFFLLSYYLFSEFNNIGIYLITFIVMYICFYIQVLFGSKFLGLRIFITK